METRERNGKWESREVIDVKYAGIDGLKAAIADAESRFTDIDFDVDIEPDYGGDRAYAHITGWRPATPDEIAARQAELAATQERTRAYEAQMVEQLRQSRPELFK